MAEQNFLQRGLSGFRSTVTALRTGEGDGAAAALGRAAKKAVGKKQGAGTEKVARGKGFSGVDAFSEEDEEQHRRRKANRFFGDDEPSFVGVPTTDPKRDLSTVAPEFRGQVSSGLAAANSLTTGSTLVGGKDD